jgi:hypothetical protein
MHAAEVPLTGAFYLCNYFPELRNVYTPGEHVETFRNKRDLLD